MFVVYPNFMQRYRRLSRRRRLLLVEATARLALVSAQLRLLPFRRAIRLGLAELGRTGVDARTIEDCVWAVQASGRAVPWRAVCIQQGLCLQQMLRRRGVNARLHYGVRQHDDAVEAHVWVTLDGKDLIGGEEAAGFARVADYPVGEGA